MSFPGNTLPSFPSAIPVEGVTKNKPSNTMTLHSIKEELTALGTRVNAILKQLPHTALGVIEKLEAHLGIKGETPNAALHLETLAGIDGRLGEIVKRLEHCTAEEISEVEEKLGMVHGGLSGEQPNDAAAEGLPVPDLDNTTEAPTANGAVEAPNPDQAVS